MGIPSYYKKLCEQIPGIVRKTKPSGQPIQWLWIDFNCMIYHCLQRDNIPTYPSEAQYDITFKIQWENTLIKEIEKYLQKVIALVEPTDGVYIAVDGVVPLAKMKQQRMRRFKAIWEKLYGPDANPSKYGWDKNAITPGTEFMNRLCKSLSAFKPLNIKNGSAAAAPRTSLNQIQAQNAENESRLVPVLDVCGSKPLRKLRYIFSGVNEPGEGEHKIMDAWRNFGGTLQIKNCALYGLDADLIVLGLINEKYLGDNVSIYLFREDVHEGQIVRNSDGEEQFVWFNLQLLKQSSSLKNIDLDSYLFSMVALGNDFLPSGFSLKLREDGHDRLLNALEYFSKKQQSFFTDKSQTHICYTERSGLAFFLKGLASDEEMRIETFIRKKKNQAGNIGDQIATGQKNWPLGVFIQEEGEFLSGDGKLSLNWKELYLKKYFHGSTIENICQEYLIGLQWVWDYYVNGANERPDKWSWYYPWHMPPLWCWLHQYLLTYEGSKLKQLDEISQPPLPIQQLTMVLPFESYDLIPEKKYRFFYQAAQWYFPQQFAFSSAGKRFFWECEADIPIVSLNELKAYLDIK